MKGIGHVAEGVFGANDQLGVQTGAMGMPPTPGMGALSTAGDAVTLAKSAATIAEPGAAPNSAWGNALISGGKLALSFLGESVMPGGGAEMVGMMADQAKAAGDAMLPGGTAGAVGGIFNRLTGLGGGAEPTEAAPAAAAPAAAAPAAAAPAAAPAPAAAAPAPAPAAPARAFPNSPLATDADVYDRLSH
jgi:pyruvate/2-oxoglutarate dehydrogenase complex dihydrolipoamide acyltransferase (E2) component